MGSPSEMFSPFLLTNTPTIPPELFKDHAESNPITREVRIWRLFIVEIRGSSYRFEEIRANGRYESHSRSSGAKPLRQIRPRNRLSG